MGQRRLGIWKWRQTMEGYSPDFILLGSYIVNMCFDMWRFGTCT